MALNDFYCSCGNMVTDSLKDEIICKCGKRMVKRVSCHALTAERWKV